MLHVLAALLLLTILNSLAADHWKSFIMSDCFLVHGCVFICHQLSSTPDIDR